MDSTQKKFQDICRPSSQICLISILSTAEHGVKKGVPSCWQNTNLKILISQKWPAMCDHWAGISPGSLPANYPLGSDKSGFSHVQSGEAEGTDADYVQRGLCIWRQKHLWNVSAARLIPFLLLVPSLWRLTSGSLSTLSFKFHVLIF